VQVDLSWQSVDGLTLYVDGQLVDTDSNPATNELDFRSSRRVFIGRANTDMRREHFTNGIFDSVEFWQASRDVLKAESYLSEGMSDQIYYILSSIFGIKGHLQIDRAGGFKPD